MTDEILADLMEDEALNVIVEFMPETLREEIQRGLLMQDTLQPQSSLAQRVYTTDEQQQLPFALRNYLFSLEQQGLLSPLHREWVIESVQVSAARAQLAEVPMPLLIATLFVIAGLQGALEAQPPSWLGHMHEVSLQVH